MRLLVSNIGTLAGVETAGKLRLQGGEMKTLGQQDNAWLLAENGKISAFGSMERRDENPRAAGQRLAACRKR